MAQSFHLGIRLVEERNRLGLTQEETAEAGGVSKRAQGNYERGERSPDSNYWGMLAKLGFDAQYILTGVRSINLFRVAEDAPKYRIEPTKKQVDPEVLQGVIAAIKEYLSEADWELSPAKEAELVMLCLDFANLEIVQEKSALREMVAKVIEFKFKRR